MPTTPKGRMTLRRNAPGDGQKPKIRLWTLGDPPEGSTLAKLQQHYLRVFENVDRWDTRRGEIKSNAELTDIGKQRATVDFGFGAVMPDILRAKRALHKAEQEVASRRAKLQQPKSDPADLAAALRRQEIRGIMRSLDDKGRDEFLRKNGLLTGLHPEIRQALIEMPPALSGITQAKHDQFMREATEAINTAALDEITALEKAIEITASALSEGRKEIQQAAIEIDPGFADPDRFEARAAEAAKLEDQPWLKIHNENGSDILRVFDWDEATKSGGWRIPTSDQIENGIVAETKDEYIKLKTAAPLGAFGAGDEGRKARAEFINERGVDAYLNRHQAA
jgi:hypothetical protein